MPGLFLRMLLTAGAITIGVSGVAHAQAVTKFDGAYKGVSNTGSGGGSSCFPGLPVPRPLTIRNGAVQWVTGWTGGTTFQGTVTADGGLSARGSNAGTFFGKVDGSGKITGGISGTSGCTITSVWQK
jgi:hypothetical protein